MNIQEAIELLQIKHLTEFKETSNEAHFKYTSSSNRQYDVVARISKDMFGGTNFKLVTIDKNAVNKVFFTANELKCFVNGFDYSIEHKNSIFKIKQTIEVK